MKIRFGLLALAVCLFSQVPAPVTGQSTPPPILSDGSPTEAITFGDNRSVNVRSKGGRFPLVAADPNKVAQVQLQLTPGARSLTIALLDGGVLNSGAQNSAVAADGTTSFQIQPGAHPGLYRVLLIDGGTTTLLPFWVADPQNPRSNPPTVQAH